MTSASRPSHSGSIFETRDGQKKPTAHQKDTPQPPPNARKLVYNQSFLYENCKVFCNHSAMFFFGGCQELRLEQPSLPRDGRKP